MNAAAFWGALAWCAGLASWVTGFFWIVDRVAKADHYGSRRWPWLVALAAYVCLSVATLVGMTS